MARSIQARRYSIIGNDVVTTNARCPAALLEEFCGLNREGMRFLEQAAEADGLSALSSLGYQEKAKVRQWVKPKSA
jgi:magnesium chelatase family protein